jgi:hypothetical protein
MSIVQGWCEECEELMFGGKCRNPDCIKRKRKGAVIWGGAGLLTPPIQTLALGTASGTGTQTITIQDVLVREGATLVVGVAHEFNSVSSLTVTWGATPLTSIELASTALNISCVLFALTDATAGSDDIVIDAGSSALSIAAVATEVFHVSDNPIENDTGGAGIDTSATVGLAIAESPVMVVAYAAILEVETELQHTWSGGFSAGQTDGTTAAPAGSNVVIAEGLQLANGSVSGAYGPFTSTEWATTIVSLRQS